MKYSFVLSNTGFTINVFNAIFAARKYTGKESYYTINGIKGYSWEIRRAFMPSSWTFYTDDEGLFTYVRMMI